jgi:rSAM/selenodomain-associated transferase 1
MPGKHLIVFVKAPRPGLVKTRLAEAVGPEGACAAYCTLAEALFQNLSTLRGVELRFSPDDAVAEIRRWQGESWQLRPQGEGDLGQRLQAAFEESFAAGKDRVAIIGSDCPWVRQGDIEEAWRILDGHDVVLGPATDGGYWLVGLRAIQTGLFRNISWSSERVLKQTIERAEKSRLKVGLLRELADVDTREDWDRFVAHGEAIARSQAGL